MCFHNSLSVDAQTLENRYSSKFEEGFDFYPVYHASAFSFPVWPVILNKEPFVLGKCSWGLIPFWVKNKTEAMKIRAYTLNAVSETAAEKPSFREPFRLRRCIVPSTGFFEWKHTGGKKYPFYIFAKEGEILSFAGLWDLWKDRESGKEFRTFTILTTRANTLLEEIHNTKKRMPVILAPGTERLWLEDSLPYNELSKLLNPCDVSMLDAFSVKLDLASGNTNNEKSLAKYVYSESE